MTILENIRNWKCLTEREIMSSEREWWLFVSSTSKVCLRAWGFFWGYTGKERLEEGDQGSKWIFIMIKVMIADIWLMYSCFLNKPEVGVIRKTGYAALLIPQAYMYRHTIDSWRSGG